MTSNLFFYALTEGIDIFSSFLLIKYICQAFFILAGSFSFFTEARNRLLEGVFFSLHFKLAAALLKTLSFHSWNDILLFTVIFFLRLLIKSELKMAS